LDTPGVDEKYLESLEVWCGRRMGKTSGEQSCENEVLYRGKEERNTVHNIKRRKPDWVGHIFCRDCLLKHVIEGKIEGTRRQVRRRKQLLILWKREDNGN
jgi:hypothetical protein